MMIAMASLAVSGCNKAPETPPAQKPLVVVELTASDCRSCQEIHRIVDGLRWKYKDWLAFATLNVTNRGDRSDSQDTARNWNARDFVTRYQDRPGTVAILDPKTGLSLELLQNDTDPEHYELAVQKSLKALGLEPPR